MSNLLIFTFFFQTGKNTFLPLFFAFLEHGIALRAKKVEILHGISARQFFDLVYK